MVHAARLAHPRQRYAVVARIAVEEVGGKIAVLVDVEVIGNGEAQHPRIEIKARCNLVDEQVDVAAAQLAGDEARTQR